MYMLRMRVCKGASHLSPHSMTPRGLSCILGLSPHVAAHSQPRTVHTKTPNTTSISGLLKEATWATKCQLKTADEVIDFSPSLQMNCSPASDTDAASLRDVGIWGKDAEGFGHVNRAINPVSAYLSSPWDAGDSGHVLLKHFFFLRWGLIRERSGAVWCFCMRRSTLEIRSRALG